MSRFSNIFLIVALVVAVLVPTGSVSSGGLASPAYTSEAVCGSPLTVRLLTDKNVNAGTVTVANGETSLFVTYTTNSNYKLTATHLTVVNSLAGIPKTNKGNPVPGQFPYQSTHNKISTFTYTIPLAGLNNTVIVAAHADVVKTGTTTILGAWGEGTMFNPKNRSWGMYFSYSVQPCNEPPVAAGDAYSVDEDTTLNVAAPGVLANDTDPDGDPLTAALVAGPANGTLSLNTDGSFSYTPNADFNGSDSFTYKANDGSTDSNVATVNITVNPVNDAPAATNDTYSVDENSILNVAAPGVLANDTDVDGDALSAILVSGPAHGTLTLNADGSFTYTPNNFFHGADSFTYKANDGIADSNVATVNISVDDVNFAPVATDDAYSVDEDTTLNVAAPGVLANDNDPDGDPITAVLVDGPTHGSLTLNADGSFSYTPAPDGTGPDSFTYKVNDGALDSNVATVTITRNPVNDPPYAEDDEYSVDEDNVLNIAAAPGVLGNDYDIDGFALTAVFESDPAHGTLTLNTDGSFTYTPDANYNGSDSFTYKASDGGLESSATVSITVNPVNDAPAANNDSYNATETVPLNVSAPGILANDSDADNDPLTAVLVSGPSSASSFALNNDGSFSYTANAGTTSDSFTYKANDGQADSNVATVNITVAPPNAAPVAAGQQVTVNEDEQITITLSATDADGDSLTFSIVSNPSSGLGSLGSLGTVTCVGSPSTCTVDIDFTAGPYPAPDSFTFKANDGQADSNVATVDITVNPVNDPPYFTAGGNVTVAEDSGPYSAGWATKIYAGSIDEDPLQTVSFLITGNTNPALFSAGPSVASNGILTFTPAADAFGTATITLVAQDDGGTANGGDDTSDPVSFDITVTSINDVPSFTKGGDQTVDEDAGPQTVNGWATGISAGPNEGGQTVTFVIDGNDNPSLFSAGPAVAANGTLTYTPAANQNGVANITLHIQDDGGTANGGVDTSATQSFVITVNAVNDAPVALVKTASAQANMKIVGVNPGLLTGVTDADSGVNGCTPTFSVASIASNTGGTVSNVNLGAGTFDFDPAPGFTGTAVVNYTVQDTGCPGTATSAPTAINITVSGPVIWFVNPAGAAGDGRLSNPFNTLTAAAAVDAADHRIFVYTGTATGSIALHTNEWLIGQGVSGSTFDALFSITPPTGTIARPSINGTRPVVQGNVAMATNDVVRGLNIQPASGTAGLTASGATSLTVNEISVTTVNATAVGLTNSDGTFSFTRIDANGGLNGIVWNNASPATGSFTVIGTGSAGSGGTIQNTTGHGIALNNARSVSLDRMIIQNTANDGINGSSVTDFSFTNSTIAGAGDGANEYGVFITNLFGTGTINNDSITNSQTNNLKISNNVNTAGTLTITNSVFTTTDAVNGGDCVNIETGVGGSLAGNLTVSLSDNNDLNNCQGDGIQSAANDNSTLRVTVDGSNSNYNGNLGSAVNLAADGNALMFALVQDLTNVSTGTTGSNGLNVINIQTIESVAAGPTLHATVQNNSITALAGGPQNASGIRVIQEGKGTINVRLNNNTINGVAANGIVAQARAGNGQLNMTVNNNTINLSNAAALDGISIEAGSSAGTDTNTMCLNMFSNNSSTASQQGYRLRKRALPTFNLQDFPSGTVQNWINTTKLNVGTTDIVVDGGAFTNAPASCTTPTLP